MARVDHLLVATADLGASVRSWRGSGFDAVVGGTHPGGTHNALVRGAEPAYIELIAAAQDAVTATARRVRDNPGPLSWAVAVDNLDDVRATLESAGYTPGPVIDGTRVTPRRDRLAWRSCDLGSYPVHEYMPFLIEWSTPMPEGPSDGPRLRLVTLEVPDPGELASLLEVVGLARNASSPEVAMTDGHVEVRIRGGAGRLVGAGVAMSGRTPETFVLDGLAVDVLGNAQTAIEVSDRR